MMNTADAMSANPWEDRATLPRASRLQVVLAIVADLLCSLFLPLSLWSGIPDAAASWMGLGMALLLSVYVVFVAHAGAATGWMLGLAYLSGLFGMGLLGGAWLLALMVSAATGAFLMTVTGRPYFSVLIPLIAFAACMLLTQDAATASLAAIGLPSALLMAYATLRARGRTSVICFGLFGFLAVLTAGVLLWLYQTLGTLQPQAIAAYIQGDLRDGLFSLLQANRDASLAEMTEMMPEALEMWNEMYSDAALLQLVDALFPLVPAMAVLLCMIPAFAVSSFLPALYKASGLSRVNTPNVQRITVSLPAAVVYTVSFFVVLFSRSITTGSELAQNLTLILLPGLCILAFRQCRAWFARSRGMRLWLIVLAALLFCGGTGSALYLFALIGAYAAVGEAIRSRLPNREHDSENDT